LFALPSDHENFGISVIEALAAGTPVIISDQVNIQSEIRAAEVGAVVRNDVTTIASELERWLKDEKLRTQAAERARPFVWKNYDWAKIAEVWKVHYQNAAARAQLY